MYDVQTRGDIPGWQNYVRGYVRCGKKIGEDMFGVEKKTGGDMSEMAKMMGEYLSGRGFVSDLI